MNRKQPLVSTDSSSLRPLALVGLLGFAIGCGLHALPASGMPAPQPSPSADPVEADTGHELLSRVPGPELTLQNISEGPVALSFHPTLLGPDRAVLERSEAVEARIERGAEFSHAPRFEVPDGFYTIELEFTAAPLGARDEDRTDRGLIEWRVEIVDGRTTTADDNAWLAAIQPADVTGEIGGAR